MSVGLVTVTLFLGSSFTLDKVVTAVTSAEPVLTQTAQNGKAEADRLLEAGRRQYRQGRVQEALEAFQQVLAIRQSIGDRNGVAETYSIIDDRILSKYSKTARQGSGAASGYAEDYETTPRS